MSHLALIIISYGRTVGIRPSLSSGKAKKNRCFLLDLAIKAALIRLKLKNEGYMDAL